MRAIWHESHVSSKLRLRITIFRAFNLLIMIAFANYHMKISGYGSGLAYKIVAILITLYLSYLSLHLLHYPVRRHYGKTKNIENNIQIIDTYNSRLINVFVSIFLIVLVSIIRILGFDTLLEAGGAIGIVGVFLALTQNSWAPDMFSGLIILNSRMVEVGDVIEFNEGDNSLGVVYKTKIFHTEILNLVNNHRIMI